jgi:hypothetical protein
MSHRVPRSPDVRRVFRGLVLICAAAALDLTCASRAEATCGDYLLHADPGRGEHLLGRMGEPDSAGLPDDVPRPCQGPACSRKDAPANSPPPRISVPARQPACLAAACERPAPETSRSTEAADLSFAIGEYPPILRPPR